MSSSLADSNGAVDLDGEDPDYDDGDDANSGPKPNQATKLVDLALSMGHPIRSSLTLVYRVSQSFSSTVEAPGMGDWPL